MENNTFKSAMFGGFNRQDVIDYIGRVAAENTAAAEQLRHEQETLQAANAALEAELLQLRSKNEELQLECTHLGNNLEVQTAAKLSLRGELEEIRPAHERMAEELETLRPLAEEYQRIKGQIGAIECEARKRADELEESTAARLRGQLKTYREQYKELVETFAVTSTHVTSELRRVEVNLAQLPRTFDKMSADLSELENILK